MDYLKHYTTWYKVMGMFLAAAMTIGFCLFIILMASRKMALRYSAETCQAFLKDEIRSLSERFYELVFSNTSVLLFVSLYFMIDYFGIGYRFKEVWAKYNGIILLVFLMASILMISFMDNLIVPLRNVQPGDRAAMRLMGMLYMLIIFAYIKFVYQDSNYDNIIMYFLTMVIGRFVYLDASLESFQDAMKDTMRNLPLLLLGLLCTILISLFGWGTGYLIRVNGVVFNLFIAHLYLLLVIFIVHRVFAMRYRKQESR